MFETLFAGQIDPTELSDESEAQAMRFNLRRLVAFNLSGELYGLSITTVAEIREILPIMPLPSHRVAVHVLGLINLRGSVLPVIDLRRKFGLTLTPPHDDNRLIILKGPGYGVALWVESVHGLARLPESAFQPAPPGVARIDAEYYEQIATLDGRMLIELNTHKILAGTAAVTSGNSKGL